MNFKSNLSRLVWETEADHVRSLEEALTCARLAEAGSTRALLEAENRLKVRAPNASVSFVSQQEF